MGRSLFHCAIYLNCCPQTIKNTLTSDPVIMKLHFYTTNLFCHECYKGRATYVIKEIEQSIER